MGPQAGRPPSSTRRRTTRPASPARRAARGGAAAGYFHAVFGPRDVRAAAVTGAWWRGAGGAALARIRRLAGEVAARAAEPGRLRVALLDPGRVAPAAAAARRRPANEAGDGEDGGVSAATTSALAPPSRST